jgi:Uma2 family endonuclease
VSRSPGFRHQFISDNLVVMFRTYLNRHPIGTVVSSTGAILSEISAVIPDLMFISDERMKSLLQGDRIIGAPELIIEILSPGAENSRRDRIAKRRLYGKDGVRECWLVDPETKRVELYALNNDKMELKAACEGTDEITSEMLPGFICRVESIFRA